MGITQQIGASSLIKPGVIDNTAARPASPFEGQVIFQKDTDQLLVWNGTAWVIPNSPAQNPQGLEFITSSTVGTAVSSVTVSSCFSATYDNYKIIMSGGTGTANTNISFAFNGSPAGWDGNIIYANYAGGAVSSIGYSNLTNVTYAGGTKNSYALLSAEVSTPFLAQPSGFSAPYTVTDAGSSIARHSASTSYTGFILTPSSGTLTGGTITVYGYRK